jgi:predicted nucleotidyltransferase
MRVPVNQNAVVPSPDAPALSEVLRRLVAAYDPERVYLFGSVARGEAGPDSDYDLMCRTMLRRKGGGAVWRIR